MARLDGSYTFNKWFFSRDIITSPLERGDVIKKGFYSPHPIISTSTSSEVVFAGSTLSVALTVI